MNSSDNTNTKQDTIITENTDKEIVLAPETNDVMQKIFLSAKKQLDNVEQHNKILLHDLVDKVVAETHIKATIAQGLISMFLEDWVRKGEGTMETGRAGGIFKNGKKPRFDGRPRCELCHQVVRSIDKHSSYSTTEPEESQ